MPDANGQLHYPGLAQSVREKIQVLLSTRPGEQLMNPGFGAGLENLLTEPNTVATRSRIQELVGDQEAQRAAVMDAVSTHFRPEFINRIDEVVVFHPLGREQIRGIADIQLELLRKRLAERELSLELEDDVMDKLAIA